MTQKYRTTCFADALVDYPGSLEDTPTWREEVVGFRIVCSPGFQTYRGSSIESARPARGELPRSREMVKVGIRLIVDWRHI